MQRERLASGVPVKMRVKICTWMDEHGEPYFFQEKRMHKPTATNQTKSDKSTNNSSELWPVEVLRSPNASAKLQLQLKEDDECKD